MAPKKAPPDAKPPTSQAAVDMKLFSANMGPRKDANGGCMQYVMDKIKERTKPDGTEPSQISFRYEMVKELLADEKPDIAMLQEVPSNSDDYLCDAMRPDKNTSLEYVFLFSPMKENTKAVRLGIVVKKSNYKAERISQHAFKRKLREAGLDWDELEEIKLCPGLEDGEQASLTNYLTCLYNDRMLVALCKSESGGQDIIAVSYHGNNNCAYMKKQKYCQWSAACKILTLLADAYQLPVLFGCDANFRLEEEMVCRGVYSSWLRVQVPVYECKPGRRFTPDYSLLLERLKTRKAVGVIDFVGTVEPSPQGRLGVGFTDVSLCKHVVDLVDSKGNTVGVDEINEIFDHDPIVATVRMTEIWSKHDKRCELLWTSLDEKPTKPVFAEVKGYDIWEHNADVGRILNGDEDSGGVYTTTIAFNGAQKLIDLVAAQTNGRKKGNAERARNVAKLVLMGIEPKAAVVFVKACGTSIETKFYIKCSSDQNGFLSARKDLDDLYKSVCYENNGMLETVTGLQARLISLGVPFEHAIGVNVQLEKTTTGGGKKGSVIYVPKDPSEIYRIFTQQNKNCPPKDQVFLGKNGNLITFQGEPKVANHKVHGSFLWAFPPVPTQALQPAVMTSPPRTPLQGAPSKKTQRTPGTVPDDKQ